MVESATDTTGGGDVGTSSSGLQAGYASSDITPALPVELAGHFSWRPRLGRQVHDPLHCRVVALRQGERCLSLASLDVLCVSEQLHRAILDNLDRQPQQLMLLATHTHSSFGGLFPSPGASVLGQAHPRRLQWLAGLVARTVQAAEQDLRPARARFGRAEVAGFTSSRRRRFGPRDDEFRVLTMQRNGARDLVVVNASGHPVVVSEKDPQLVSADWPGELCRRLEAREQLPLFFPAALGGTSPLFPEFPMELERHLQLLGDLALQGVERAREQEQPLGDETLSSSLLRLPHPPPRCQALSPLGLQGRLADLALWPLRSWLRRGYRRMLAHPGGVPLHLARLGELLLVGSAHEMGAGLVGEILRQVRGKGREAMVASLADGYAGYLHLEDEYHHRPEKGFRFMSYYENALAVFGRHMSAGILEQLGNWQG